MGFEPGKSGNPAGRPKQKPFLDWCKKWTVEQAEKHLVPLAENPGKQQLDAIKTILAYGIGKPVETVDSTHQFEGMDANPNQAKELLGQIIAGETIASLGLCEGGGTEPGNDPAAVSSPQREAGGSNP